jgi:hypothetical protein
MTFLGRYLETSVVPNQQIVIQFSDAQITKNDSQKTIEAIQQKLYVVGVKDIQVSQNQEGQLKITYFSKTDIHQIENILSDDGSFKFAHHIHKEDSNDFPKQKNLKDYELNISEIQENSTNNWDFESVQIVEFNQKIDRFSNPKISVSGVFDNPKQTNNKVEVAVKINNATAISTKDISCKIPDTRAGPLS